MSTNAQTWQDAAMATAAAVTTATAPGSVVPSAEAIASLEAKYGRIAVNSDPTGTQWCIIIRKPKRAEYREFRDTMGKPGASSSAQETLIKRTCVYVGGFPNLDALLEEWPGAADACGGSVVQLVGLAAVEQGKS